MTDTNVKVREHYSALGLTDRIKAALAAIAPENQTLTVPQLAPLDQFHTRGILGHSTELADAAELAPSTRVLDLGCGIGKPARYLAATFGCKVIGVDLSPGFVDAATYLTERCELSDRVSFQIDDALRYWGQAILHKYLRPAARELGIEKRFGWHTFRHMYSTF